MPLRRSLQVLLAVAIAFILVTWLFAFSPLVSHEGHRVFWSSDSAKTDIGTQTGTDTELQHLDPVACFGPRGKLLNESPDDQLQPQNLNQSYAQPLGGSYDLLGLSKSWMTGDGRYGPYGLIEEDTARAQVDWDSVNWALLQDDCLQRNAGRFQNPKNITAHSPLQLRSSWNKVAVSDEARSPQYRGGRTAIVLRSYQGYKYKKEDLMNIRSLIVEAALSSGGAYSVILLVDMKDRTLGIWDSALKYDTALNATVPPELRSIAVLWDETLLRDWYPKVGEYSPSMQMPQALQLFAQVYDDFDHYWQWEMDARLTGDALNYFDSLSNFAKASPRKQSFERSSYRYIPFIHGDYSNLFAAVNASVQGRGSFAPIRIPEVKEAIDPAPPSSDPLNDNFEWGVGDDADFIAIVPCKPLPETSSWPYKDYVSGFTDGVTTPRIFCPQASSRISWNLLNVIHTAQVEKGLRIASESTAPSYALWHGLKLCQPPQPWFLNPPHDEIHQIDDILNGGPPSAEHKGFAYGINSYDIRVLDDFNARTQQNWWWRSKMPGDVMRAWLSGDHPAGSPLPYPLVEEDGKIYAPNMALHPFKTNHLT